MASAMYFLAHWAQAELVAEMVDSILEEARITINRSQLRVVKDWEHKVFCKAYADQEKPDYVKYMWGDFVGLKEWTIQNISSSALSKGKWLPPGVEGGLVRSQTDIKTRLADLLEERIREVGASVLPGMTNWGDCRFTDTPAEGDGDEGARGR